MGEECWGHRGSQMSWRRRQQHYWRTGSGHACWARRRRNMWKCITVPMRGSTSCLRYILKLQCKAEPQAVMYEMRRPMRVAMLIQEYPPIIGGAEQELAAQ